MSDLGSLEPQPAPPNAPEAATSAPFAYLSASAVAVRVSERFPFLSLGSVGEGLVLAASMALDEEGPFFGVKVNPEQEREWPRSFRYGWPNIEMIPDAMYLTQLQPGAFYLNYEGVIPYQVLDWVALECYRMSTYPLTHEVASETVTGASVRYIQWTGQPKEAPAQLDRIQAALISPFQMRQARQNPWPYYGMDDG